ncbi:hypothetical protein BCV70DRAFT_199179 [Testicularia cyperi]|uniref:Trafficking protein particle complex subunit 10 n=1 Tax=Testicularia cyperi TaxID=1882483 RepID=A0A317XU10_9BASI|nr:hypothetical protein BCV70DRAFT_199179 [Testicularia cyperi]
MSSLSRSGGGGGGSTERITVTYAASPAILSAPLTPHFTNLLKEQLPLRNLHWRPSQSTLDAVAARAAQQGKPVPSSSVPGATIRTIQTLDVALKPLTDEIKRWRGDPGYFEHSGAAGLLDRPFVHLYLVVCDDSEHYRTTVRNEIRSWISSLSFFHAKQAAATAPLPQQPAVGTPSLPSASRNSLGFGSFRSSTPPTRPETPKDRTSLGHAGSNPSTPSNGPSSAIPTKTLNLLPTAPAEPEYLIVLINPPEGAGVTGLGASGTSTPEPKSGMGRLITKSKGNVLEKIKADFNTSKKEHVVHLSRLPPVPAVPLGRSGLHSMDPTIWAELITRMKEAASSTFTTTIEAQEEEIMRCGATRGQQGWDFCSYFLAKDALATTLEGVGLRDDAVGQYEDLEINFAQAMQNGAVAFAPIGGDGPNDDSLPLLEVAKKPYSDLIRRKEISLFDFRCYLFARKSALLGKMGRVAAVMREAPLFIGAIGRMLRRNPRIGEEWIESWMFSAALDVVEQCQAWLIQRGDSSSADTADQLSPAFHANKSELLDLARRQLDRIGIQAGHLPNCEPFDRLKDQPSAVEAQAKERDLPPLPAGAEFSGDETNSQIRRPSRPELVQAIESREHFDSHYLALCERIMVGWNASSRKRNLSHTRMVVAALDYHRRRLEAAHRAFVSLAEAFAEQRFAVLEAYCLAMQLECHERLQRQCDRAWIATVLSALKANRGTSHVNANEAGQPSTVTTGPAELQKWHDAKHLFSALRSAATGFDKEVPVSGFAAFSVVVADRRARLAGSEDGSLLTVRVLSSLPFDQPVEDVRVCLTSANNAVMWYTSLRTVLRPGLTELELFCPHVASGTFAVDVTQIRVSKLIFQYALSSAGSGAGTGTGTVTGPSNSLSGKTGPVLVKIPKDGAALDIELNLPRRIDLDQRRLVEISLFAGRHDLDSAEIAIHTADGASAVDSTLAELLTDAHDSTGEGGAQPSLVPAASNSSPITVSGVGKGTTLTLRVPLSFVPETGTLQSHISVSYVAAASTSSADEEAGNSTARCPPGKRRTLRKTVQIHTALPLGVNVQDFFRASSLLSKFTISAGGGGSIRLLPVKLSVETLDGGAREVCVDGHSNVDGEAPAESMANGGVAGGISVTPCSSTRQTTVTPRQPATYLFRISKQRSSGAAGAPQPSRSLRLSVQFRTLVEDAVESTLAALQKEIAATLDKELEKQLAEGSATRRLLFAALGSYIRDRLDLPAFSIAGEIRTGNLDLVHWNREMQTWGAVEPQLVESLVGLVEQTLTSVSRSVADTGDSEETATGKAWQTLTIPVEIPTMDIVNTVSLQLGASGAGASSSSDRGGGGAGAWRSGTTASVGAGVYPGYHASIVVGRPVDLTIVISSSDLWASSASASSTALPAGSEATSKTAARLVYDVLPDFETWLVSGPKKGSYTVDFRSPFTVGVSLIPLRPGSLTLPTVSVRPVQPSLSPARDGGGHGESHPPPVPPQTPQITSETHITNIAQRVLVTPANSTKAYFLPLSTSQSHPPPLHHTASRLHHQHHPQVSSHPVHNF